MKIAITSQNFRTVTAHAGKARRFIIYDLPGTAPAQEIERLDLPREMCFHEFRGSRHPIYDVDVLITGGAGAGLAQRLAMQGVHVVVCGETDPLQAILDYRAGTIKPPIPHDHDHGHDHEDGHQHG